MKKNFLTIDHWKLFLILFLIPILQLATGYGIQIGSFIVGLFPFALIYLYWLLLLLDELEKRTSDHVRKYLNLKLTRSLLVVSLVVIIPFNWVYTHLLYYNKVPFMLMPISGILLFVLIFALLNSWGTLSKCIFILDNESNYRASFSEYWKVFLYFLLGPMTIWALQPIIIKAIKSEKRIT